MDWSTARTRLRFLAEALNADGGFAPKVVWTRSTGGVTTAQLSGPSYLVRYPRESDEKFGARNALAKYENHLASACGRFAGFLSRRRPVRDGIEKPLVKLMVENADLRGQSLDAFFSAFAMEAKARGSMLLVIDKPEGEPATSLADQIERRRVPYIRMAMPEAVTKYRTDPDSGLFLSITLACREWWNDEEIDVERDYTTTKWKVRKAGTDDVLAQGVHAFGACPVLAFTEDGSQFPKVGKFAQVADLSMAIFNKRSEKDELLRSQTFSLLTLQVPPEMSDAFEQVKDKVTATIGTNSMLMYPGEQPAFIAPDAGPAETYAKDIEALEAAIRRISMEESTENSAQAESGVARRLRFEALNSDLAGFAQQLQQLEQRMWSLFDRALSASHGVTTAWPTDFNLADVQGEIDILLGMQTTGFPPAVLNAKRKAIVATEFDSSSDEEKAAMNAAIDEMEQQAQEPQNDPNDPGAAGAS